MRLLNTLNVKLLVPIICLWAFIFLILSLFVLNPVSGFLSRHIQDNMQWLADRVYAICDDSLDSLIRSGKSTSSQQLRIRKARTLRQIEVFCGQHDVLGIVYISQDRQVVWKSQLPVDDTILIPMVTEHNQVIDLNLSGVGYSSYHFSFDPWQWHIVLIKRTSAYASFINRVTKAYIATTGIWVLSLIVIICIFNIVIKKPIYKIIAPLDASNKPSYRGTVEFEFLSKNIERMMDALHNAKQSLENRVEERTKELKKANKALKKAKKELSLYSSELEKQVATRTNEITSILRYTPAVVYIKDTAGRYLLVNSRYEELFNVKNVDVRGKYDSDILPIDLANQFRVNDQRVLKDNQPLNVEEKIVQNGQVHTYLSVKFPIFADSGKIRGVCGIASDITPVKKAQDQLRRLSGSIMASQEKERAAIARELHDELGQAFTALRIDAYWLKEQMQNINPIGVKRASGMCSLIDRTSENMHNLAIGLRPGVLDDLGIVEALEWYTEDFERRTKIQCTFEYGEINDIDGNLATAAYRIAQEALTNVARHSNAKQAQVRLKLMADILILTISDDGCGFQEHKNPEIDDLGLIGMRERAALVGGNLTVESTPGHGTRICFRGALSSGPVA